MNWVKNCLNEIRFKIFGYKISARIKEQVLIPNVMSLGFYCHRHRFYDEFNIFFMNLDVGVFSGFRREVGATSALLGYYAASNGNSYRSFGSTYRSVFKSRFLDSPTVEDGPIICHETSVRICHCSLCNNPKERSSK
jgi:hypothetical protein